MLQICRKLSDQQFEELSFEEEILTFLRDLSHSEEIKVITDVNVNKLHQPWRSFAAVISKCLSGKSIGYDSLRSSNPLGHKEQGKLALCWGLLHVQHDKGAEPPKTKASVKKKQARSDKAPKAPKGKRLKATAKVTKPSKKKIPTKGLETLSEVALTEEEQMRIISWKSSSGEDDDAESENDNDVDDADNQDDDGQEYDVQDDENQDANNEQTDLDNDGDDFVYPKLSTHNKEDKEEDSFDPRVQTPSHVESTDDEDSDEEIQDTEMTDAPRTIIQTTQVIEDTHVIITPVNPEGQQQSSSMSSGFVSNMLNPSPDTGIDSIFNLNTESTSLVDVLVTTIAEPPLLSVTILPPPPTPLITHLQQTPVPTPATVLSSSLKDLPNFVVSSIPGIVDAYLANKMHESVKIAIQLQSNRPRDEAQAENADLINKLDDNIKKIVKDQVKEQTSQAIAANLSELELKKILIDKMESNKTINISDEQKNLYKALFDAYESDKLILDTYGDTILFKRRRDDEDKDEEPSAGSNRGSKRRIAGKEPESTEEPMHTAEDLEEPVHQEFLPGDTEDIPDEETFQLPDWFQKLEKPPTPDRDWNNTLPAAYGPVQPWLSTLAQKEDTRESFNKLMDTHLDFSAFVMNRLKVDTLTLELLASPTFELMKGSCKSLIMGTSNGLKIWSLTECGVKFRESARDVYSKRIIIAVTKLQIVEWHNYKHPDWITIRKLKNLTVEERLAFNVSLRMFTRSIVIQRRVEDLQLGVESYQKKLNLTKPDTYRSDLKRREAYTAYSNPEVSFTRTKTRRTD
ncbi:hypothetical protein Tco_0529076 [Tanacetum coccineum]